LVRKRFKQVRHQARKHEEAHNRLKELLRRRLFKEKVWDAFVGAFVITIITIVLFFNWGRITSFFGGSEPEIPGNTETLKTIHGFQSGVLATYQLNGQTADQYIRYIRQIPGGGYSIGMEAVNVVGKAKSQEVEVRQEALLSSITLVTNMSKGYHLTSVRKAGSLQKSVPATYYLGEKTINISSTLQTDAALLGKINNALSVDVFAYLNQSESRADSLENYLNLLKTLNEKAKERSADLASVINFLTANFNAQNTTIGLTEDAFFANLKIFNGPNAEQELGNFIGLQQDQSEIKAKIGAYKGLKEYYDFFLPKLDNLIRAIDANRDPLIAGVKVVEVQNMTLPLIIKER
jgi:hypothetical protein